MKIFKLIQTFKNTLEVLFNITSYLQLIIKEIKKMSQVVEDLVQANAELKAKVAEVGEKVTTEVGEINAKFDELQAQIDVLTQNQVDTTAVQAVVDDLRASTQTLAGTGETISNIVTPTTPPTE